ncbi:MAG: rod shape-determining protein [Clostridia bacterium]|nr:rod shape-determining protein [Clostridiales bacterium]MBQ2976281.1 rod shape-determining protein [Clostridia bacterium]MBQ6805555.1 rod shape-determining protein [Clostridia bacterium]MDD6681670.1 rod shape-determining protein [Clostridiales bacterium]
MATVLDIGVDLGTASVVIYGKGKGVVLNEPAVIAYDRDTRNVLAVGEEARRMMGRTPSNIVAMRPLGDGMIADFELASAMLRYFVTKVVGKRILGGPRVLISMPAGVNEVERHSIMTSLFEAGARRTQLMERPIAAAIGAGLPIGEAYGQMICDIGGGVTDIAVMAQGRIIVRDSVKIGGDLFDDAIIRYIRRKHNLLIGELTAEDLKINVGSAVPRNEQFYMEVTGRNLISGLPKVMRITSDEITEALDEPIQSLLEAIHAVLEHTPAELVADIFESGIVLSGGGAQLAGLCEAVSLALKVDCHLAEDPQECVARGCGLTLENLSEYGQFLGDRKKRG